MEITTLDHKPEYFNQVISLIEESFGYEEQHSFAIDFYPLINRYNHNHCWILIENNKLIGHVGVRVCALNNSTPFAMMGGIAIDKDHRGQGYFKEFFNTVIKKYQELDFLLLWTDQHALYEKFGFEFVGKQYTLKKVDGTQSSFEKVRKIDENTKEQVQSLYNILLKNELSIERTKRDWDHIWNITSADLYIAKENRDIKSYFFMNKGQDLPGIIHESYFHSDHHLEAACTIGTLWLPHQYEDYAEFDERLGLVRYNKNADIDKLWVSGMDSI